MSVKRTVLATALAAVIVGLALPAAAKQPYPQHYTGATQARIATVQSQKIANSTRGIARTNGSGTGVVTGVRSGLNLAYPVHYWSVRPSSGIGSSVATGYDRPIALEAAGPGAILRGIRQR